MPKHFVVLALIPTLMLSACYSYAPYPVAKNIDVSGTYLGRIANYGGSSVLLDITVVEKNLAVTATIKSRADGQTYTLTGTRSIYDASPVSINLTGIFGSGSACAGGSTNTYGVSVSLSYSYNDSSKVVGSGSVIHRACQAGTFTQVDADSGQLELSKQ